MWGILTEQELSEHITNKDLTFGHINLFYIPEKLDQSKATETCENRTVRLATKEVITYYQAV